MSLSKKELIQQQQEEAYRRQKLEEIERKVIYMRANHPPKALLRATSRERSSRVLAQPYPTKLIVDEDSAKMLLQDQTFNKLKETIKGRPPTASNYQISSPISAHPVSPIQSCEPFAVPETPVHHNETHQIDYATHPMVVELARRGLTSGASKRKLQATVKREIEQTLTSAGLASLK